MVRYRVFEVVLYKCKFYLLFHHYSTDRYSSLDHKSYFLKLSGAPGCERKFNRTFYWPLTGQNWPPVSHRQLELNHRCLNRSGGVQAVFVELTARYRGRVRGPGSRLADWVLAAVHHADTEELHTSEESLLLKAVDRSTDLPLAHDCVHLVRHGTHRGHGPRPPRNGNNKYSMLYTTYVYEKLNIFCAVFIDCGRPAWFSSRRLVVLFQLFCLQPAAISCELRPSELCAGTINCYRCVYPHSFRNKFKIAPHS